MIRYYLQLIVWMLFMAGITFSPPARSPIQPDGR